MSLWTSIVMIIIGKIMGNLITISCKIEKIKVNELIRVLILIVGMGLYVAGGVKALSILKPLIKIIK